MIIADAANWDNSMGLNLPGSPVTQTARTTAIYLSHGPGTLFPGVLLPGKSRIGGQRASGARTGQGGAVTSGLRELLDRDSLSSLSKPTFGVRGAGCRYCSCMFGAQA